MLSFEKQKPSRHVCSQFPALQSWKIVFFIAWLEVATLVAIQSGWLCFTDRPSFDFAVVVVSIQVLFAVWVWFFSRIEPTWHLVTISTFVGAHIGALQLVRLEGFAGDGRPIWTWRWKPSPHAAINWEQRHKTKIDSNENITVDLLQTTPFDFPAFRGHNRTGEAHALSLARDWKTTPPRLLWKQPIGAGWSSFAVVGNYCLTQ